MDDVVEVTPAPRPHRRWRSVGLVSAGLVAGVVVAGLNVASAQSPAPSPTPKQSAPDGPRGRMPRPFRQMKPDGPMGALHGEFTTKAPGGGYQVLAMQRGTVTAVSATSLTVKSEDGYTRTYGVDDHTLVNAGNDGIGDVKTGNEVRVVALVKGDAANAVQVLDLTTIKDLRGQWAPRRQRPGMPRPSASSAV